MFRIAAFARLGGISSNVLRDYDRLGIFRPAWVDRDTGYRMYTPAQLPDLRRILALRDVGVGLREIGQLVAGGADLRDVLARRQRELEDARREIDRRLASVGVRLEAGAGAESDVVVREITPELVATLDVEQADGDEARAFYLLELAVRDAGVRAPRPPGTLYGDDGVEVFVPVRRNGHGLAVRRLPAVRAATILHRGSYASIDGTRAALEHWIAASGATAHRPERVIYLQFGAEADLRLPSNYVVETAAELLTELQVPLEPAPTSPRRNGA